MGTSEPGGHLNLRHRLMVAYAISTYQSLIEAADPYDRADLRAMVEEVAVLAALWTSGPDGQPWARVVLECRGVLSQHAAELDRYLATEGWDVGLATGTALEEIDYEVVKED